MARFYGSVSGRGREATRLGTPQSGLRTIAAGWQGAIRVSVYPDPADTSRDLFQVELVPWQGSGGRRQTLVSGVLDSENTVVNIHVDTNKGD